MGAAAPQLFELTEKYASLPDMLAAISADGSGGISESELEDALKGGSLGRNQSLRGREFASMTALLPTQATCRSWKKSKRYFPYWTQTVTGSSRPTKSERDWPKMKRATRIPLQPSIFLRVVRRALSASSSSCRVWGSISSILRRALLNGRESSLQAGGHAR